MEEKEIIKKVLKGDNEAFAELFFKHEKFIFNVVKKIVKLKEDAEDITQDVFIKAYENLTTFRGESKFSVWLYRIAYNLSINFFQRRKEKFTDDIENIPEAQDIVDKAYEQQMINIYADEILQLLPAKYRIVLDLYYFKELSYEEIAETLKNIDKYSENPYIKGKKHNKEKN